MFMGDAKEITYRSILDVMVYVLTPTHYCKWLDLLCYALWLSCGCLSWVNNVFHLSNPSFQKGPTGSAIRG